MGSWARDRRARGEDTAKTLIRKFLVNDPDARWRMTVADIAREIGVSRQMASLVLPGWRQERQHLREERVRAVAQMHPDVRPPIATNLRDWPSIAAEVGLPLITVKRIWRDLGLPVEARPSPAEIKRRSADVQRRRFSALLGTETCVVCGVEFPWTGQCENARRYKGRSVTCSRACSYRYYHR